MFDHIQKHRELIKSQIANVFKSGEDKVRDLIKSEGSRGGKIIGHTKSGKAIYDSGDSKHFENFTKEDHEDAAEAHNKRGNAHHEAGNHSKADYHWLAGENHTNNAKNFKKSETESAFDLLEKSGEGEGSKGGKVIGHTKSGKPIYDDPEHKEHKEFSSQDHRDAADLHHDNSNKKAGVFPGYHRAKRNKHHDLAIAAKKKEDKQKLKSAPGTGDKVTTKDGISGDVKHRDDTHTYLEYSVDGEDGKKKSKISKIANEDLDAKITAGHYTHHKPTNIKKSEEDEFFEKSEGENWLERLVENEIEEFEKSGQLKKKDAFIGEIREFAGRPHIKTADGWKYHGKGGGVKAQIHANTVTNAGHGLGENAGSQHEEEVNHRQKLAEEREELIKEKTGDINFKFKMFAAAIKGVITGKFKSAIGYGTGGVGKTYTVLGQLDAAGKTAFDEEINKPANTVANTVNDNEEDGEEKEIEDDGSKNTDYDYVKITGYMSAPELYKTMYEHNGKILMFDDCDKVLTDGACVNLFKGALDTSGDGTISYSTKSGVKDEEGSKLPKRFKYTGRCIFISNLKPESMPQPLKSRGVRVDLSMDRKQTIERIRKIAQHPTTQQYSNLKFPGIDKYSHQDMRDVIDYIDEHRDHLHMDDLNVRTIGKVLGLKQIAEEMGEGKDWKRYADQTIFSKSESFNYNGGLMKAREDNINSIYKSCGDMIAEKMKKKPVYKSEDVESGIHISDEQLNEAGVEKDDQPGSDKVEKGGVGSGKYNHSKAANAATENDYRFHIRHTLATGLKYKELPKEVHERGKFIAPKYHKQKMEESD